MCNLQNILEGFKVTGNMQSSLIKINMHLLQIVYDYCYGVSEILMVLGGHFLQQRERNDMYQEKGGG